MTKLCPRGKAAAKRKFKVYPSAYANAYASKICAGKIKDPSGVKRKDFRGSKAKGGRIGLRLAGLIPEDSPKRQPNRNIPKGKTTMGPVPADKRKKVAGGGLMEATARLKRQGLKRGGGVCLRGMNRDAVGKNS